MAGAGVTGAVCCWAVLELAPCITEVSFCCPIKVRLKEVTMKRTAAAAVSFARKGAAPVLPNTVWLEPPKAAPIPAPLPCCKSTIKIRAKLTKI